VKIALKRDDSGDALVRPTYAGRLWHDIRPANVGLEGTNSRFAPDDLKT